MESAATTVYAQGGRGNTRLIAWEGEKTLTFTMEDALISPKGLAILSGADLIQAGGMNKDGEKESVIAHVTETIEAKSTTALTVKKVVAPKTDAYVMLMDSNGEMSGIPIKASSASEKTVTIPDGLIEIGDVVMIDYYSQYESDAMQIDITPDKFAGYYYLEASTLFRRESDGADLPAEFIIPKVKIQSNFTFSMASTGDPSSFTFTMDAFPDYVTGNNTKKVLASIQVLEADDNNDNVVIDEELKTVEYKRYGYNKDGGSYIADVANEGPLTQDDLDTTIYKNGFSVDLTTSGASYTFPGEATHATIKIGNEVVATTSGTVTSTQTASALATAFNSATSKNYNVTNSGSKVNFAPKKPQTAGKELTTAEFTIGGLDPLNETVPKSNIIQALGA